MTKITIYKKNGNIYAYKLTGHANKGAYGEDILCAALSSVSQAGVLGLKEVLKLKPIVEIKEGLLYLEVSLNDYLKQGVQEILQTVEKSLADIIKGENKHAKMEVKDEIY